MFSILFGHEISGVFPIFFSYSDSHLVDGFSNIGSWLLPFPLTLVARLGMEVGFCWFCLGLIRTLSCLPRGPAGNGRAREKLIGNRPYSPVFCFL